MPTQGTLTLHMREAAVGEGKIKTQPGKFSIAGEGLNIGKEGAEPVTDDYPGEYPWRSSAARSTRPSSTSAASRSWIWPTRRAWRSRGTERS